MLGPSVTAAVEAWLSDPAIREADKGEVSGLLANGDERELTDRFYRELEFGTGGLRGIIGAGLNRMNLYTVGAASQGLANYVSEQGAAAKEAGIVIAFDCRRQSDAFSRRVACVMAGNGITAYLFEALRPTPQLSFAVRHLGCTGGIVITASHNPPEYNGFKAYWTDGGQVTPPHDQAIIEEVRRVGGFGNVRAMEFDAAQAASLIRPVGRELDEAFLDHVQASCLNQQACQARGASLKIVYTSLHGTGGTLIPEALRRRGFRQVIEVPEQAEPDGEFPTVASPNPEEAPALNMAIELARREGADLVIGTDPDADRVGIAVRRSDGEYELISGNRIGALLTHYICQQLTKNGRLPTNAVMITTIVSGDLMKDIARSYGAEVVETLTGFKWIGRKLHEYEQAGGSGAPSKAFVFGAEESYGYMPCAFTRDKDAVTSSAFIAEMAAVADAEGKGLYDVLCDLFRRFGYYQEGAKSIVMKGPEGSAQIKALMETLRASPPANVAGYPVASVTDILTGRTRDLRTGEDAPPPPAYDLPESNVLIFTLEDGTKVIARPSGTEPKIKFYILVREAADDLAEAKRAASAKIESIIVDLVKRAEAFSAQNASR